MTSLERYILYFTGLLALLQAVNSLSCYSCASTEPGCGQQVNIRLQHFKTCPTTGHGGGENFCVKQILNEGGSQVITRGCLMTFRSDSNYRQSVPTVQRHGYCSYGRNDDPWNPFNENLMYCFCNDWNGCNGAQSIGAGWLRTVVLSAVIALVLRQIVLWYDEWCEGVLSPTQ